MKNPLWRNAKRRVNQQVQNYKTYLKNSHFGVEKFNSSLGLSFNFFCTYIIYRTSLIKDEFVFVQNKLIFCCCISLRELHGVMSVSHVH